VLVKGAKRFQFTPLVLIVKPGGEDQ